MMIFDKGRFRSIDARRASWGGGRRGNWPVAEVLEGRQLLATVTVNSVGDVDGADGGATLSLRQAIEISDGTLAISALSPAQAALVAGALSSPNTIDFAITGTGPFVIEPATALPTITSPVVIDGYSQPGAHPRTNGPGQGSNAVIRIELDGAKTQGVAGLTIEAGLSTVDGLAIGGFAASPEGPGYGIILGEQPGDLIEGDFIGTDTTGTAALPNSVGIQDSSRYNPANFLPYPGFNTIGGTAAGAGNVISGNTGDGLQFEGIYNGAYTAPVDDLVQGNLIGTNATLTDSLPNGGDGVDDGGGGSTIGGTAAGAGNVISGNIGDGLAIPGLATRVNSFFSGTANDLVQGNLIGAYVIASDPIGDSPLPNGGDGVDLTYTVGTSTVGGEAAGAGNLIAYNAGSGVAISPANPADLTPSFLVSGNSIDANGDLGIKQNPFVSTPAPVLDTVEPSGSGSVISGVLDDPAPLYATANLPFTIEFFASPAPDPSGFGQGQTYLGSVRVNTDDSGNASFTFSTSTPLLGRYVTATATFVSTSEFSNALLGDTASTTTTVAVTSGVVLPLQPVTLTAGVVSSGEVPPTGQVTFSLDGVVEGTSTLSSGIASLVIFDLRPGSHTIQAAYLGDPGHAPSQTGEVPLDVRQLTTSIVLSGPESSQVGQPVTLTGTVPDSGLGIPTGLVSFAADGVALGTAPLNASGVATFTTTALEAGDHTIQATYLGDALNFSSPSNILGVNVLPSTVTIPSGTTTALVGPGSTAMLGQPLTFTAFVTSPGGVPTGQVAFLAGGVVIGMSPVGGNGLATFVTDSLSPGVRVITASYLGDGDHSPSLSNPVAVNVLPPDYVILLGPNRVATQGQPITFSALGSAGGVPPGAVIQFFDGDNPIGSGTVDANGEATFVTDQLSPGLHVITAAFLGDAAHLPSGPSNAVAVNVFNATAFGGPSVASDVLDGPHAVTVTFNRGLLLAPAQDAANYKIVGPHHKSIAIASAVYNPANASVTLTTEEPLDPRESYELTINGQSGERVVDVFGIALNGKAKGKPGHDYSGKIRVKKAPAAKVAHPKAPPKPEAHASAHKKGR